MRNIFRLLVMMFCLGLMTGCATLQQTNINQSTVPTKHKSSNTAQAQHLFEMARSHQQKNELVEALNAYEKVIHLSPTHYEAYNNMGMIYFMIGEDELGMQFFSEAIRLAPALSSSHNNLGYALLKQERYLEAAEALERAVQLDPSNFHARNNLSAAYRQMGCQDGVPCRQPQGPK